MHKEKREGVRQKKLKNKRKWQKQTNKHTQEEWIRIYKLFSGRNAIQTDQFWIAELKKKRREKNTNSSSMYPASIEAENVSRILYVCTLSLSPSLLRVSDVSEAFRTCMERVKSKVFMSDVRRLPSMC